MKKIASCIVSVFLLHNIHAQPLPELPLDFFDKFRYTLSKGFTFSDSLQLKKELGLITAAVSPLLDSAEQHYTIHDSTLLYYFTDWKLTVDYQLGRQQQAIAGILQARNLKPTPQYSLPYKLAALAYATASQQHADDGSTGFSLLFKKILLDQFQALPPDFQQDIVNQQKGLFSAASTGTSCKNLEREFTQAIGNAGGELDMYAVIAILTQYQGYYLRKYFQPLIEEALYTISPARVKEQQIKIPMRDGVYLNAYVYTNETVAEKVPAIIALSPYPSGNEATKGNVFATNGYSYVYVDTRGRRESGGTFMPYEDDARDYYDIIDWVSKQPWCNGKVATSGGSYLGFAQWQTIRKEWKHPALKAINPMVAVGFGVDFPRAANQFYPYILQWATYVSGKEMNQALFNDNKFWNTKEFEWYKSRLPFSKLDSVTGMPNPIFQKWISHPDFDSYWKSILPKQKDYEAIDIPIFSITGYYDGDQNGALYYYNQHMQYGSEKAKQQHYLLIGPYEHFAAQWQPGPIQNGFDLEKEAQIPIYKYVIWWFDWVLKGKNKPAFIKNRISYFETGSHQWKGTTSFKKLATDSIVLFLSPVSVKNTRRTALYSLDTRKPAAGSLDYRHDIAQALDSSFLYATQKPDDDSLYLSSSYNLVFESQPLEKDIVLADKIRTRIYISLNTPDADFDINVHEITPDGQSRVVAYDAVRVRYREGGDRPRLAKPGEIVTLRFTDIYVYVKKIIKGSKLRFEFQSTNRPWTEKNYGFGGVVSKESSTQPRWIEAKIYTGGQHASKIVLPIVKETTH